MHLLVNGCHNQHDHHYSYQLLSTFYVLGTVLKTLLTFSHVIFASPLLDTYYMSTIDRSGSRDLQEFNPFYKCMQFICDVRTQTLICAFKRNKTVFSHQRKLDSAR